MTVNKNGAVFLTVLIISMLMIFIAVSASNMLLQDAHMIRHLKRSTQAQYLAEAGISDALVTLIDNGFSAKDTLFPLSDAGDLGEGSYRVTSSTVDGRVILESTGTISGVSRTMSLEVKDSAPTSLNYMMSSGANLRLRTYLWGQVDINGNIHANNNVELDAWWMGRIDIDGCGSACCDGSVSACGEVELDEGGSWWRGSITIHGNGGVPIENAAPVIFPNFDYAYYKNLALTGGGEGVDHFSGDKTWNNATITPSNGIVYVEGRATFYGTCHLNGGIVADDIRVSGRLYQHETAHNRNVIISKKSEKKKTGNIRVSGRLNVEKALIYAENDFRASITSGRISMRGALLAGRNLRASNPYAGITYQHQLLQPDGLTVTTAGGDPVKVVSWN